MNNATALAVILPGESGQLKLVARRQLGKMYRMLAGNKKIPVTYWLDTTTVLSTPVEGVYQEVLRDAIKKSYPQYATSPGLESDPTAKEMKDKLFRSEEHKQFWSYVERDKERFKYQVDGVEDDQTVDPEFLKKWVELRSEVFRRQHLRILLEEANAIFKEDDKDPDHLFFKRKPDWLEAILQAAELAEHAAERGDKPSSDTKDDSSDGHNKTPNLRENSQAVGAAGTPATK